MRDSRGRGQNGLRIPQMLEIVNTWVTCQELQQGERQK